MSYPKDILSRIFQKDDISDDQLLYPKEEEVLVPEIDDILQTNIFNIMINRRSQRKFENKQVEDWKIEMKFPHHILKKFSMQDASLAAAYSQLAAHALGLSSVWIGMIDEEKVMQALGTDLVPSSILCLGYPQKILQPKPKRNLLELIHEV